MAVERRAPILSEQEIQDRLTLAKELARTAGQMVLQKRIETGVEGIGVSQKGHQDFVTMMDQASEDLIRSGLADAFPDDGFVGEESEGHIEQRATWVVDPIDGTTNYIRGFDHWGISIALVSNDIVVAGIIYKPSHDLTYSAALGAGAWKGSVKFARPDSFAEARTLAVVGYNHKMDIEEHLGLLRTLHRVGCDFRNNGSAAIDLIDLAEGKVDFTYIHRLNSWDVLAALLIAKEAGAVCYCPALPEFYFGTGPVFAGDAAIVDRLRNTLIPGLPATGDASTF